MMIGGWSAVGFDYYDRHHWRKPIMPEYINEKLSSNWGSYKYQDIYNHRYSHETVILDGKRFLAHSTVLRSSILERRHLHSTPILRRSRATLFSAAMLK
jgi:hypothetical protein